MRPIFRILYRCYRIISGLRYWAWRRFTPAGLVVLGALVVATIMGPDTDNNVAYQAFTLLLFMVVEAMIFSRFFRARFSGLRVLPRFGTVGQPFHYRVTLKNLSPKTQRGLMLLEELADPRPSFEEWQAFQRAEEKLARPFRISQSRRTNPFKPIASKAAPIPTLTPGQEGEVRMELLPLQRGVVRFTGLAVARTDPLGLCRGWRKFPAPQKALILPKRYPLPPLALPGTMKYQAGGVALASSVGQSDEFVSLRDYRHGDPVRHIHWRSWAKAGKPVVKEFEDEFFVRHALVLDTFINLPRSVVFEEAVSVAASFACAVRTQESLLDLLFVGAESYCFTAGRGLAHVDQMLEILAAVRPCPHQRFSLLEKLVLGHLGGLSGCVCVLLAWDEARRSFVRALRALGVPVLVLLVVPAGQAAAAKSSAETNHQAGSFHVLEAGQIEQGLARLGV